MSTANFAPMKYNMPLICGGLVSFEDCKEDYEKEFGEEYTMEMFEDSLYWDSLDASTMAEEFSDTLKYHEVYVESGYYVGFQFMVRESYDRYFDLDKESDCCIGNEDANYYFGKCRSKVLREADSEKRRIRKWLKELPYEELKCVGIFSSGEAIYERV